MKFPHLNITHTLAKWSFLGRGAGHKSAKAGSISPSVSPPAKVNNGAALTANRIQQSPHLRAASANLAWSSNDPLQLRQTQLWARQDALDKAETELNLGLAFLQTKGQMLGERKAALIAGVLGGAQPLAPAHLERTHSLPTLVRSADMDDRSSVRVAEERSQTSRSFIKAARKGPEAMQQYRLGELQRLETDASTREQALQTAWTAVYARARALGEQESALNMYAAGLSGLHHGGSLAGKGLRAWSSAPDIRPR